MYTFNLHLILIIIILSHQHHHHHNWFNAICFLCLQGLHKFLRKSFKFFVFSLIIADFPLFRTFLIVSLYVSLSNSLPELPPTSNFPHLIGQELFSILDNQTIVMLFSVNIDIQLLFILSSTAEILSPGLTLHIHLNIIASFFYSVTTLYSSWPSLNPIQHNFTYKKEYNLLFACMSKPWLVKKKIEFINLLQSFLILPTPINCTNSSSCFINKIKKLLHNFKRLTI